MNGHTLRQSDLLDALVLRGIVFIDLGFAAGMSGICNHVLHLEGSAIISERVPELSLRLWPPGTSLLQLVFSKEFPY